MPVQAVEATGEAGQLVHKSAVDAEAQLIVPITGHTVMLPQNWVVHGQETWQAASVSTKYQDHSLWSQDFLVEMLQYFFTMAEAVSFPQLDEFAWRMDKVQTFQHTCCILIACSPALYVILRCTRMWLDKPVVPRMADQRQ